MSVTGLAAKANVALARASAPVETQASQLAPICARDYLLPWTRGLCPHKRRVSQERGGRRLRGGRPASSLLACCWMFLSLTSLPPSARVAPSQALADHSPDPLKFPSRPTSRLTLHDDDDGAWESTLRPLPLPLETHRAPRSVAHSRESSFEKLASGGLAGIPESPAASAASTSPRIPTSASSLRQGLGGILERVIDPKAAAYGHHRQTSIVHGIQHSRNGSLASSSSSPLSPQMIAAAGVGLLPEKPDVQILSRMDSDPAMASRPPTAMSGTTVASNVPTSDGTPATVTQRRVERMHSKTRRDHSHHHSHSSRHHNDQKTVGEYALHVLFTHVSARKHPPSSCRRTCMLMPWPSSSRSPRRS